METFLKRGASVMRAIEMRGGEVVELRDGAERRFAAVDRFGAEVERFDAGVVARLREAGRLTLRRFERGGSVWGLASTAQARAAYFSR